MPKTNYATTSAMTCFSSGAADADLPQQCEPDGAADPDLGVVHAAQRRRRRRRALECGNLALPSHRLSVEDASNPALRPKISAPGHDDPGLGRHLRRARALLR